jgi:hypothetical protein
MEAQKTEKPLGTIINGNKGTIVTTMPGIFIGCCLVPGADPSPVAIDPTPSIMIAADSEGYAAAISPIIPPIIAAVTAAADS